MPFEYRKNIEFLFLKIKYSFLKEAIKLKLLKNGIKYCLKLGLEDIQILLPVSSVNSKYS